MFNSLDLPRAGLRVSPVPTKVLHDIKFGKMALPVTVPTISADSIQRFLPEFEDACDRFLKDSAQLDPIFRLEVAARFMESAIKFNDVARLDRLCAASPLSLKEHASSNEDSGEVKSLTPYGTAALYARGKCMHILARAMDRIGEPLVLGKTTTGLAVDISGYRMTRDRPEFTTSVMWLALEHFRRSRGWTSDSQQKVYLNALRAMNDARDVGWPMHAYIPAYLASGIYDIDPATSFRVAVMEGWEQVVRHLEKFELRDEVGGDTAIYFSASNSERKRQRTESYEQAIVAAIEVARSQGTAILDDLMRVYVRDGALEPITRLICAGHGKALMEYVKHGYSASEPIVDGFPSMLEISRAKGKPEIEEILLSGNAREAAYTLLAGLSATPFPS